MIMKMMIMKMMIMKMILLHLDNHKNHENHDGINNFFKQMWGIVFF